MKCIVILDGYTQEEKDTLLKYTVGWDEIIDDYYHNVILNKTDDEIFQFERRILNEFKDRRRENILKYLSDFNKDEYNIEKDVGYPVNIKEKLERNQEKIQEKQGYIDEFVESVKKYWCGGFYEDIQDYLLTGKAPPKMFPQSIRDGIMQSAKNIEEFINNSQGLEVDTVLFRGGGFDSNLKLGNVKTIPCFNSTSYSKENCT